MRIRKHEHGFTLIEMIVSLVVLALLGAAAGKALTGGALAYNANAEEVQILGKLRYASERLARETREIRRSLATPTNFDIATMTSTTLAFNRGDGTAVTLTSNPPLLTLAYAVPAGTHTLTDEVSSASFAYYQLDAFSAATSIADVAFIEFDLVLSHNGNTYPQRTRIALRNQQ